MEMTELLSEGLARLGITPPEGAVERLSCYGELLLEQNKVMNLTAIRDPEGVARLHFLDSAALLLAADLSGKTLLDVGAGAGFPGFPVKLLSPTTRLTALDSLKKRMDFLSAAAETLGVTGAEFLHARAEEQAMLAGYRDSFDFVTARAVAALPVLTELCLPFVRVGGQFLCMKSTSSDEELKEAAGAIKKLGGRVVDQLDYTIPGTDVTHRIIRIEKIAHTPKGYPRRFAKITKAPLK